jgi:hypothetical protein
MSQNMQYFTGLILFDKNHNVLLTLNSKDIAEYPGVPYTENVNNKMQATVDKVGLSGDDIRIIKNTYIDEFNERGTVSHRYFVGTFDNTSNKGTWFKETDVHNMKNFFQRRKDYLIRATEALNRSLESDFIKVSDWTEPKSNKEIVPSKQKYVPRVANTPQNTPMSNGADNNFKKQNLKIFKNADFNLNDENEWPALGK